MAWVSRQGAVVLPAPRDCTVPPVPPAAALAVQAGRRLSPDAARRYRAVQGSVQAFVNHTQKESARGDGHEKRAEWLVSLLKPSLRSFRGRSKTHRPGAVSFVQCLRHFRSQHAFAQTELSVWAA
jgi:hypothetical protein